MPPEEDARAILQLALRHEQSLGASLDPGFAQENWEFLAQQCVENLLKAQIVLADQEPPLSQDQARLQLLAGARLPEDTPLPASRERLLALIRQLREGLEARLSAPG